MNPGIVVAAGGHVDHDHLCELAAAHFRPEPGAVVARPELSAPGFRHVARFSRKDTEQYHVCLGGPGPRRGDPDRYAVFVVDTILGGSWSSLLFQEVREKRGLAYSVYSYTSLYADAGLTAIYVGSREEAVDEAMTVILDVLDGLPDDIADEAVERAKNHLKGQLVLSMESPGSRMQSLGRAVLMEQPVLTVDEVLGAHRRGDRGRRRGGRAALLRPGEVVDGVHRPAAGAVSGRHRRGFAWEEDDDRRPRDRRRRQDGRPERRDDRRAGRPAPRGARRPQGRRERRRRAVLRDAWSRRWRSRRRRRRSSSACPAPVFDNTRLLLDGRRADRGRRHRPRRRPGRGARRRRRGGAASAS